MREAITHAIQLWKAIPGSDTPEPSEAGSSTKGIPLILAHCLVRRKADAILCSEELTQPT